MIKNKKDNSLTKTIAIFEANYGVLHTQQALDKGISPHMLYQLRDEGTLICESRGVFRLATAEISARHDIVQVSLRVSRGVICLISALEFYDLTTQIPHQVYVALPAEAEKPRLEYPPLRIFWLSPKVYSTGIEQYQIEGIAVKIYNVEKTIMDCFKFRNKIGLDVAVEALRIYRRRDKFDAEKLLQYAVINRVERVVTPYLEALQ
jgi:predicted transcriptional regulator of viral defense system